MSWSTHGERMLPISGDRLMCLWPAVCHAFRVYTSLPVSLPLGMHVRVMKETDLAVEATCELQSRSHVDSAAIVKRLLTLMCRCDVHRGSCPTSAHQLVCALT